MYRVQIFTGILLLVLATWLLADGTTSIIKVNGRYGIINKGANQGVQEGQLYSIKREMPEKVIEIGKVKVIRVTANRAAIQQVAGKKSVLIRKGDKLFGAGEVARLTNPGSYKSKASGRSLQTEESKGATRQAGRTAIEPIREPSAAPSPVQSDGSDAIAKRSRAYSAVNKFRKPWVSFNAGAMVPGGDLAQASSSGTLINGSYMVSLNPDAHMGIEISQSFVGGSDISGNDPSFARTGGASVLSAALLFQRFFGRYFFVEGGGGIFRPKLTLTGLDGTKTSYSSTHFGFVGGAGFYIPTSPFAGLIMKGRFHNYFDQSNKHFLGVTGGFRFKIR